MEKRELREREGGERGREGRGSTGEGTADKDGNIRGR